MLHVVLKLCIALRERSQDLCDNVCLLKSHLVGFGFHGDNRINRNQQNHHSHSSQHRRTQVLHSKKVTT